MRDFILQEIRRLASANGGQAPGMGTFQSETGIGERQWRGLYWSRWSDALKDAGLEPNKLNERADTGSLLAGLIAACRHFGRLPTEADMQVLRRTDPAIPHPNVLKSHFGKRADLIAALAKHVANDPTYADVIAMLPDQGNDASQRQPYRSPSKVSCISSSPATSTRSAAATMPNDASSKSPSRCPIRLNYSTRSEPMIRPALKPTGIVASRIVGQTANGSS